MRIVMFYHSLISDWNHGNAHFLRGVVRELMARGHDVRVFEPADGWSAKNLRAERGTAPFRRFASMYPDLTSHTYDVASFNDEAAIADADVVLVHEWNEPALVRRIGLHHAAHPSYALFFHDTHHRAVTDPESMQRYDLSGYDGVLAFGNVLRDLYLERGWTRRAWTWHEAADVRLFHSLPGRPCGGDLVWVGNWGDDERTAELHEFLLEPVKTLGLRARVYGVRYPETALQALRDAGIEYGGWLPNFDVPETFARFRVTVHVPRRPYVRALPGIPTIRVFEAMACGIPLVCAPWNDAERLFTPGEDFLVARDGREMVRHLRQLLDDPRGAEAMADHARRTILSRHTCGHRADQLMRIVAEVSHQEVSCPTV